MTRESSDPTAPGSGAGSSERAFLALLHYGDDSLGSLVRAFNLFPLRYAHPSWVPEGWPPMPTELLNGGRAEARLSAHFMIKLGFDDQPVFAFGEPHHRLALMHPDGLDRLALLTGAALRWEAFAMVLERDEVREIKAEIGEEAYRFAILKAPILAGKIAGDIRIPGAAGLAEALRIAGMEAIAACVSRAPRPLRTRLALKFPKAYANLFLSEQGGPSNPRAWRLVKNVLLQEVDPAWETLLS